MARINIYLRFVFWLCLQNTQNIHRIGLNEHVERSYELLFVFADNAEQS